jgi:transglutaminase-like putative cysteine protease
MVICILLSASSAYAGESSTSAAAVSKQSEPVQICGNASDFSATVRSNMLARNTVFSIRYNGSSPGKMLTLDTFNKFLDSISAFDDPATSSDGDYLKLNWTQAQLTIANNPGSLVYTFSFKYLTTAEDEAYVDKKVQDVLTSLNVSNSSDYEKVKAVSNYIIKNVSYDSSFEHKSAYDALYSGTSICRGYVLLAYKMLADLSVPVRIITGTGCDKPHVWNLVEIDGAWYNLDLTWDDTTHSDSFFLKSTSDFGFHKSDAYFNSSSFQSQYPIADQSYAE